MNRVTFKGVVEKEELLKIVKRLWNQEQKAESGNSLILRNVEIMNNIQNVLHNIYIVTYLNF